MTAITFDAIKFCKNLESAGFSRQQAEALASGQQNALLDMVEAKELATKKDLAELELRLTEKIETSRRETIRWVVGAMIAQTSMILAAFGIAVAFLR